MRATPADIQVCEISGKRPERKQRTSETIFADTPDHKVIVSNAPDNYDADWEVIPVPDDFRAEYMQSMALDERACGAPMGRSYALKYCRDHGIRYCVQIDDNIRTLSVTYEKAVAPGVVHRVACNKPPSRAFVELAVSALENTNAGLAGFHLQAVGPEATILRPRFVYSLFGGRRC